MALDEEHIPRLCHLKKWADFQGYGFNLHAEKTRQGQFVGKVDDNSPAQRVGLKEHDRIVEVNGVNISNENHQQVVNRIKESPNETRLLVVDKAAEEYYKQKDIIIHSNHDDVEVHICPDTSQEEVKVYKVGGVTAEEETASQKVTAEVELNHEPERNEKVEVNNPPDVIESSTPSEVQAVGDIPPAEEPIIDQQGFEEQKQEEPAKEEPTSESNNNEEERAEKVVEAAVVAAAVIVEYENEKNAEDGVNNKIDEIKLDEQAVVDDLENLAIEQQKSSRSSTVSSTASVDVNGQKEYDLSAAVNPTEENTAVHVTAIKSENPESYTDNIQEVQRATDETMANSRHSVVVGGVEFAGSVREAREKMKKKTDLRGGQQNMREKYDLLNRL